jgi:hypothetical protein
MSVKSSHNDDNDFSALSVNTPPPVNGTAPSQTPDENAEPLIEKKILEQIRIDQGFEAGQTRRTSVTVQVQRPNRAHWIYVNPDPAWRMCAVLFEDKENQSVYAVTPNIEPEMLGDVARKWLVTYGTRHGATNLWPIKMPDETGALDSYNSSALVIVNEHAGKWLRVLSSRAAAAYEIVETSIQLPPPQWPEAGFADLITKAFKGRLIDNIDHQVLRRLRGLE